MFSTYYVSDIVMAIINYNNNNNIGFEHFLSTYNMLVPYARQFKTTTIIAALITALIIWSTFTMFLGLF